MKHVTFLLGALLVAIALAVPSARHTTSAPGDPVHAAQITTPTPHLISTAILGVFSDGSVQVITPEPIATNTEMPTSVPSPTVTPTSSPTATATASTTHTPTPTAPVASATPTAPPEPSPTPEVVETCQLAAQFNINIRASATTTAPVVGLWGEGRLSVIDTFQRIDPYIWAHHLYVNENGEFVAGWSVVAAPTGEVTEADWWVYTPATGPLCEGVTGWGDWPTPPPVPSQVAIVVHTIIWTNRGLVTEFQALAKEQVPAFVGTKNYISEDICRDSLRAGNVCIERWPPDCPANIGTADPAASARGYLGARETAIQALASEFGSDNPRLIIELTNECLIEGQGAWWNTWIITAVDWCEERDCPSMAVLGLGPGNGSYEFLKAVREGLQYAYDHGHYLSVHAYEPVEYCGGDGSLANGSIWCAYRHRLTYYWLTEMGVDVRILITELAPGWGNTQVTQAVVNDFGAYWCEVKNDPGLYAISPWIFGRHLGWPLANLEGWGPQLARAFATCGVG